MKPPPFKYLTAHNLDEAVSYLAEYGDEAKLLAGGQSLVPILNFRLASPDALIDLNTTEGLDSLFWDDETKEVVCGAMVRQTDAEFSPVVHSGCPLIAEALKHVGHRANRNRGTIGGSLAHADPSAELPLVMTLLDGRVKLVSSRAERWLHATDFFVSYLTTALEPDEMLAEARFPGCQKGKTGWGFEEFSHRHGDFAVASAAVRFDCDETGLMTEPAIAIAGGGPTPVRAAAAEQLLQHRRPDQQLFIEASELAAESCETESDMHASAEYRSALIQTLVERALHAAVQQLASFQDGADSVAHGR